MVKLSRDSYTRLLCMHIAQFYHPSWEKGDGHLDIQDQRLRPAVSKQNGCSPETKVSTKYLRKLP